MKKELKNYIKLLGLISTLGIAMGLSIVIGITIGWYLDKWFHTKFPWFFLVFLLVGIIAGFRNILIILKRTKNL